MSKSKSFTSIFVPSATVFISSFCIMVIELVAGRIIARYLGASLYTWTAVIGVILTGITIGNYLGGRIADRFDARKSAAVLFAASSAGCVITVILNNIAGDWIWLWQLNWPLRVFCHVSIVFLLPSALLGTISPVVAKTALDRGLPAGRTIGDIYACGAAGSIAGTFAAGYYLIAAMGTETIIWITGSVLLAMSLLYWTRLRILYVWAIIFVTMMTMAMAPAEWAQKAGASVALREQPDPKILYEDESNYCHIAVRQSTDDPNIRSFHQDRIEHSSIRINDILDLQYFYTKVYAAVTEELGKDKKTLSVMAIGGGGYTFPRYIEKLWPGSRIDVVEIDPGVTKAATQAFGLKKNTTINTINMDARNYVDQLLERKRSGEKIPQYDFIYGDAFGDYSVPFQLVTSQFDEKIYAILGNDGVYIINIIDTFDSGLFVGSVINTLEATFPYVYTVTSDNISYIERNFVIIAAKHELDFKNILSRHEQSLPKVYYPADSEIDKLKQKRGHLVLTDNYCPAENLLAPMARDSVKAASAKTIFERAEKLKKEGQFAESIENYQTAVKIYPYPVFTVPAYCEMGRIYEQMGHSEQAAEAFEKAILYDDQARHKTNLTSTRYKLGVILKKLGKPEQAAEQFRKIIEELRIELAKKPDYHQGWDHLGDTFAEMGNFMAAADAFSKAVAINPAKPAYYDKLVKTLEFQGQYRQAIEVLKKQIQLMKDSRRDKDILPLQKHLESLEYKNSKGRSSN